MLIAAVDPGSSGAIVILKGDGGYVDHLNMPTIKVGSKNRVNGAAVAAFLRGNLPISHCFIEQVGAMPGGGERRMGASSAFTFGHAAGLVEGVVMGAGIPLTLVTPQSWKRGAGLIGKDKDAARSRAVQLYPGLRVFDLKGKGGAVADADPDRPAWPERSVKKTPAAGSWDWGGRMLLRADQRTENACRGKV